jgi:hypothetical protein
MCIGNGRLGYVLLKDGKNALRIVCNGHDLPKKTGKGEIKKALEF